MSVRGIPVEKWELVRDAFKLRGIDSRLTSEGWMAELLLGQAGSRVVPSGFLDADTAWDLVAESLGLPTGRPNLLELLRWSWSGGGAAYRAAGGNLQEALRRRARETAGVAGELLMDSHRPAGAEDAVALGLVCDVVFCASAPAVARIPLARAAVRLERYCGQHMVAPLAGRAWAEAAVLLLEERIHAAGLNAARSVIERADALLDEIQAQDHAHLGRLSLAGFEQRLDRVGHALMRADGVGFELAAAAAAVRGHGLATVHAERLERMEQALRLVLWLAAPAAPAVTTDLAAEQLAGDSGWVDQAHAALAAGDDCEPLSKAYAALLERAAQARGRAAG